MNKDEVLDALEDEREKFMDSIEGLSDEALQTPGVVGEWSIKDIMTHLSAWEAELVKLLWQVKQNQKPSTAHFSDVAVDFRNQQWYAIYKGRPLENVLADFVSVRKQTVRRVEAFNDKDLTDPQRYTWLEERALWEWVAGDSFEHEAEHRSQIQAWRENNSL
jgi:hypothetical protein